MERQKRWHFMLILAVIALTVYNILPSLFFYTKPLNKPIQDKEARSVATAIAQRVNDMEGWSKEWVQSFTKLLGLKATQIDLNPDNPDLIRVTFPNFEAAEKFRTFLPKAGALIPFVPSQLALADMADDLSSKTVTIKRKIPVHFDESKLSETFIFTEKKNPDGSVTSEYQQILDDRLMGVALSVGGVSENATFTRAILDNPSDPRSSDFTLMVAQNILDYAKAFGENNPIARRFYSTFTQGDFASRSTTVQQLSTAMDRLKDQVKLQRIQLQKEETRLSEQGSFLDSIQREQLNLLHSQEERLAAASAILKKESAAFSAGAAPFTFGELQKLIAGSHSPTNAQSIEVGNRNPLVDQIVLSVDQNFILFHLHADVAQLLSQLASESGRQTHKQQLEQLIYDEIARISRLSGEHVSLHKYAFKIDLSDLTGSNSLLALNLPAFATQEASQIQTLLETSWNPKHPELQKELFPIYDWATYQKLSKSEQALGLVIYAPCVCNEVAPTGFRTNSVYVIAKGVGQILKKYESDPSSAGAQTFLQDFAQLREILQKNGYAGYPGSTYPLSSIFSRDFIFEMENFYQNVLAATRENFHVNGMHRYATLEFTDVEQRILALNKIETAIHEDLLKWRDEYHTAQINPRLNAKFEVPKPTQSPLWSNFALSFKKYFRGDERKILHWGLDLSGGKTVQIQLYDTSGKAVKNDADITQGINELYRRVNKMGVSEVNIRQEGDHITLDFPGAQGLSAAELIKASSMQFHVINEKFASPTSPLAEASQRFLQEIWNEAVVTGKRDVESLNTIAFNHLYGDSSDGVATAPRSESAKILYENGLRLPMPEHVGMSSAFDDTLSKIAIFRGENFSEWQGQTHPLTVVFNNFSLEGANLDNVRAGYDPSKGNYLSFEVQGSQSTTDGQKINPRNELYNWTLPFSKDRVQNATLGSYSNNEGWRMAVILNGSVISTPTLNEALRTSAMITGNFTQREINRLEADLKAGSLSFTPVILSEKNVSPELGQKERLQGITATVIALILVIAMMVGYYRFSGVIASAAVIFNLLIMWATMQNIQATITLAGIAGMILVIGMAVDANVLVFERIREELQSGKRLAQAVATGYKKAFSAIADSNITTIIAALILLHFDSGPIKGFAISLIIGIVSSMFTALFMTRTFFMRWVRNPKHQTLKMANLIKATHFNFVKHAKSCIAVSLVISLIGGYFLLAKRDSIFGMDFTGGYSMTLEVDLDPSDPALRSRVITALTEAGAPVQDFEVRQLNPENQLRLFFGTSMDSVGKPFYGMPIELDKKAINYTYENNPRISWVVDALNAHHVPVSEKSLSELNLSWTNVSGQMSNAMRNNALIGLAIALLSILVYITFRFEFKYAVSATICLAHDVIVTMGAFAILFALGLPLQIDLKTVAALMTIVGYSLNDTIIIFDRIREDLQHQRRLSFTDLVNQALNRTLSRTTMTSATTLIVLITLVFLGGSSIFGFSLVMTLGVVFGTLSSLFIAAPILLYLQKKEEVKEKSLAISEK